MVMNLTLLHLEVFIGYIHLFTRMEKKIVPQILEKYMTALTLAIWISDEWRLHPIWSENSN